MRYTKLFVRFLYTLKIYVLYYRGQNNKGRPGMSIDANAVLPGTIRSHVTLESYITPFS
jgi:hypothetical protein